MTHSPSSTAELAAIVRAAAAGGEALRVLGRGGWSSAGTPASRIRSTAAGVSLSGLSGVVNYVPSDLTMTVRAGTTLAELDAVAGKHGQWCPLLAWGNDEGTVGATFATATTGPCAHALGRPRDIALGVEFVDGTGAIVRAGGRVVKNVAGFDLTRLVVGSFGALGVLTEITVRLRARPTVDATWMLTPSGASNADTLRRGEFVPWACEAINEPLARATGLKTGTILARFGGNRAFVDAARSAVARDFGIAEADPSAWTKLRAADPHPRQFAANALAGNVAARIKERFDPAHILNPGVLGEPA